jgi:hypothetical protein
MMMVLLRKIKIPLLAVVAVLLSLCSPRFYPFEADHTFRDDVTYLASATLEGRKSGTRGDSLAALYIRDRFARMGTVLLYENGFQPFSLVSSAVPGDGNVFVLDDNPLQVSRDFLPYSFSSRERKSGEVVFAGYGFDIRSDSLTWNDYDSLDVRGKWVLLLKGDPEIDKVESRFAPYSEERAKVLTALDHGAGGVVFVGGPQYSETDQLQDIFYDRNSSSYPVPVFQVTREVGDKLLAPRGTTVAGMEEKINTRERCGGFPLPGRITARADVVLREVVTNNVVVMVPGNDPLLKDEYIVVGAHYDHLGWGGPGSGTRAPDTVAIHPGADDNASGVALVIGLANRAAHTPLNRRSLIFAAFGAEEMGLIGSKAFTANPPVDLKKIKAMFNFDMVGRLDTLSHALSISGTLTSEESEAILTSHNPGFNLAFSGEGYGPSDHAAFYMENIPVFFFSTGAHSDYHTFSDTGDKINYEGIEKIADYAWQVISEIAGRDQPLTFREAGSKIQRSRGGRFKVTLGVMPDYAGLEKNGLRVDAVSKDKPAHRAGIAKGDIITAIDGKPVGNIYDYMNRLKTFSEGQTISVDILRNGEHKVLIVKL